MRASTVPTAPPFYAVQQAIAGRLRAAWDGPRGWRRRIAWAWLLWPLLACCAHGANDGWSAALALGEELAVCREAGSCGLRLHDAGDNVAAGSGRVAVLRLAPELPLAVHADAQGGLDAATWAVTTDAVATFNAGFYDAAGAHVGWLRNADGWQQGRRHPDWQGVLVSGPKGGGEASRLVDLQFDDEAELAPYVNQAQSMVLFDHEGRLRSRNSPRAASRTVVASDAGGQLYVVVTQGAWTLPAMAGWLRGAYPTLTRAINLDGGHEAQLAVRTPRGSWTFCGEHGGRTSLRLGRRRLPYVWALAAGAAGYGAGALP